MGISLSPQARLAALCTHPVASCRCFAHLASALWSLHTRTVSLPACNRHSLPPLHPPPLFPQAAVVKVGGRRHLIGPRPLLCRPRGGCRQLGRGAAVTVQPRLIHVTSTPLCPADDAVPVVPRPAAGHAAGGGAVSVGRGCVTSTAALHHHSTIVHLYTLHLHLSLLRITAAHTMIIAY